MVGFHLLPTSTFSHMPRVQPLNISLPLSCSGLSSGQYERLGATGHPPLIPHHSLRRNPKSSEFWDPKSLPYRCVSHIQMMLPHSTVKKNASLKSQSTSQPICYQASSIDLEVLIKSKAHNVTNLHSICVCGFSPPQLLELRSGTKHRNVKGITIFFQ